MSNATTRLLQVLLLVGCGQTGQEEIVYPVYGVGRTVGPFMAGDWEVTLEVARVGFGPAYFCATAAASSDLCPAAVAEFASSAEVDALADTPALLGDITGVTGEIRSVTYDYAITWFPTQRAATPTGKAPAGHSAHFEGRAVRGSTALRFVADVDVLPQNQGLRAVQGGRAAAMSPDRACASRFASIQVPGGKPSTSLKSRRSQAIRRCCQRGRAP